MPQFPVKSATVSAFITPVTLYYMHGAARKRYHDEIRLFRKNVSVHGGPLYVTDL